MALQWEDHFCWTLLAQVRLTFTHASCTRQMTEVIRLGFTPSKLHLLMLDFATIIINMVLVTIAYETSLQSAMPTGTVDPLLPIPPQSPLATPLLSNEDSDKIGRLLSEPPYVLDLSLNHIIHRLRSPAPSPPEQRLSSEDLIPLPNTTPWQLTSTLRILMRMRAQVRQRTRTEAEGQRSRDGEDRDASEGRTIPGGLDST
jgi:hypothetical protein